MSSSGGRPLSDRLKQFADRFAALGRPARPAGYSGLGGGAADDLSAPLVGPDSSAGDYAAAGGGGGGRYAPPRAQGGAMGATAVAADAGAGAAVHLPTPSEDMAELTALSKEAAEIMWEMAALGDKSPAADEMATNARSLQAQLRGLISDVSDGGGGGVPEATFAGALAAFDMLSTTLDEWDGKTVAVPADDKAKAAAPPPPAAPESSSANPFAPVAAAPAVAAPVAAAPAPAPAPGRQPAADEAPLISFD